MCVTTRPLRTQFALVSGNVCLVVSSDFLAKVFTPCPPHGSAVLVILWDEHYRQWSGITTSYGVLKLAQGFRYPIV